MTRVVRATLIAPLVVPLLYWTGSLAGALADPVRRGYAGHNLWSGLAFVFAFASPVAYAATLALGLPALWLVRRLWRLTLATTVAVGLVVGSGVAAVLAPNGRGGLVSVALPAWSGALPRAAARRGWGGWAGAGRYWSESPPR